MLDPLFCLTSNTAAFAAAAVIARKAHSSHLADLS